MTHTQELIPKTAQHEQGHHGVGLCVHTGPRTGGSTEIEHTQGAVQGGVWTQHRCRYRAQVYLLSGVWECPNFAVGMVACMMDILKPLKLYSPNELFE